MGTNGCVSDVVTCSSVSPQGTVLSLFLLTLYTVDFSYNSNLCHLQDFSDNSAIVSYISEGDVQEYRGVVLKFIDCCEQNHLLLNLNKFLELVVDFYQAMKKYTAVNIQGSNIEALLAGGHLMWILVIGSQKPPDSGLIQACGCSYEQHIHLNI